MPPRHFLSHMWETMSIWHFLLHGFSDIPSKPKCHLDIFSHICSDILSGIFSYIFSDIPSAIPPDIFSHICSDILSGIFSYIFSDIPSAIPRHFLSHMFWHSIWHFLLHIFWHSICHSTWHFLSHMFWHSIWHFLLHLFWHSICHSTWHFLSHMFWHSIWYFLCIWHVIWQFVLTSCLTFFLGCVRVRGACHRSRLRAHSGQDLAGGEKNWNPRINQRVEDDRGWVGLELAFQHDIMCIYWHPT